MPMSAPRKRFLLLLSSALLALFMLLIVSQTLTAQEAVTKDATGEEVTTEADTPADPDVQQGDEAEGQPLAPDEADMSGSSKAVDQALVAPGGTLRYTIVLSNSGSSTANGVLLGDTLPSQLDYVADSLQVNASGAVTETSISFTADELQWIGVIGPDAMITFVFDADVVSGGNGTVILNEAALDWTTGSTTLSASTTIDAPPPPPVTSTTIFLPLMATPLPVPTLNAGRPNADNAWQLSWNNVGGSFTYEVQEANNPNFDNATTIAVSDTSTTIQRGPSFDNIRYHRVRSIDSGRASGWSNTVKVIGGYRDDFISDTGWGMRRTTFLEKVFSYTESGNLIIQSDDKWDWGLFSPLAPAPQLPYVIEYRSQRASDGNLISHGLVFGGDWNEQETCPDFSSLDGIYAHSICFNHFYNFNIINQARSTYTNMKVLFERVDYLVYCPNCDGSPIKRLSDDYSSWPERPLTSLAADGWNIYRIEVRETSIQYYVNGSLQYSTTDTTLVSNGSPYFGLFVSTDEYNNSTWRVDYVQVMPLNN